MEVFDGLVSDFLGFAQNSMGFLIGLADDFFPLAVEALLFLLQLLFEARNLNLMLLRLQAVFFNGDALGLQI